MSTPLDTGFEFDKTPMMPNYFNHMNQKCQECRINGKCILQKGEYPTLCFEKLQQALIETNVHEKIYTNDENITDIERHLHLYLDSMLYHLKNLPGPTNPPAPLDMSERMDIVTDCATTSDPIFQYHKYAGLCRLFGKQVIEMLRKRGYENI